MRIELEAWEIDLLIRFGYLHAVIESEVAARKVK